MVLVPEYYIKCGGRQKEHTLGTSFELQMTLYKWPLKHRTTKSATLYLESHMGTGSGFVTDRYRCAVD